ncbi:p-loop containing nucleoside triphosphate hydrolase protein [Mycena kentingensis (nom. inval.)]|nr:p-loop containing nucleoside triphosphate hydrolase protein [Mycena kentingensis (nom. inval.)]
MPSTSFLGGFNSGVPLPQLSWQDVLETLRALYHQPQVRELVRFVFLGTIVQTGRVIGESIIAWLKTLFRVEASFAAGELSYEWVSAYFEDQKLWNRSRVFRVTARHPEKIVNRELALAGNNDGYPEAVYEPDAYAPVFFRYRTWHIITVNKYENVRDNMASLTLHSWGWNRKILDELVQEARTKYMALVRPPTAIAHDWVRREIYELAHRLRCMQSQALVVGLFQGGDFSYDWGLSYVQSKSIMAHAKQVIVSTKQLDVGWNPNHQVRYIPRADAKEYLRWRGIWLQVEFTLAFQDKGSSIKIVFHTTERSVLADFIDAAHVHYNQASVSRVTVHLCDSLGTWSRTVVKSRRPFSTLILTPGVKEQLLADARDFLDSSEWYTFAGVPRRRGYLLYGAPGTGKSSTIHAIAGELGLEIYFISLASPESVALLPVSLSLTLRRINDYSLSRLISETPARCILLIE